MNIKDIRALFTDAELALIDSGKYMPGRAVLDAKLDLAAAMEREACAKFCETHQVWVGQGKRGFSEWGEDEFVTGGIHQGMDYAAAIRARGQA